MFTLPRFVVLSEAAKKGFLNKEVAKISEKSSSSYQGVRVFRKLRSVRTYPGSSSTFLVIALVAAIPRCESLAQQSVFCHLLLRTVFRSICLCEIRWSSWLRLFRAANLLLNNLVFVPRIILASVVQNS